MSRLRGIGRFLALGALALAGSAPGVAAEPDPRIALRVDVRYGAPTGPSEVLEFFALDLVRELTATGCFSSVATLDDPDDPGGDLLLRVALTDYEELVEYGASIAQRAEAFDPNVKRSLVASFRLHAESSLVVREDGTLVQEAIARTKKRIRPGGPLSVGEDWAREEARRLAIRDLIETVAAKSCKGGPAKLHRRIVKARAAD